VKPVMRVVLGSSVTVPDLIMLVAKRIPSEPFALG